MSTQIILCICLIFIIGILIVVFQMNKRLKLLSTKPLIKQKKWQILPSGIAFREKRYPHSNLTTAKKNEYVATLILCLEEEQVYQQSDLTLGKLAKHLNIPRHHLSQVINEKLDCSFLDFINRYRVTAAMEKLQDSALKGLNVHTIGQEVGFNAKSTFYAAFKKFTQQTPAEFRKRSRCKKLQ